MFVTHELTQGLYGFLFMVEELRKLVKRGILPTLKKKHFSRVAVQT